MAAINLISRALAPTSIYIARVTGAHQPWFDWAPSIRTRVRDPFDPLDSNRREINLTAGPQHGERELGLHILGSAEVANVA